MTKSEHHPDNINWSAIHEKELEVLAENKRYGLKFDMSKELRAYIKEKKRIKREEKTNSNLSKG